MMITAIHSLEKLEEEKETWSFFPGNLTEAELLNSFLAIKESFELTRFRDTATSYERLEYCLSARAANEFIETANLVKVYENLHM